MKYGKLFACAAIFTVVFVVYHFFFSETEYERNARKLADRVVPAYAGKIDFRQTEDTLDVFTLFSEGNKLVIEGNNAISMATGLNYYLKNYCGVTMPWYAFEPVQYPSEMPTINVPAKLR